MKFFSRNKKNSTKNIRGIKEYEIKDFGDLQAGDKIIGPKGEEFTIKHAYVEHVPEKMYELILDDGTSEGVLIKASGNHLWYIEPEEDKIAHSTRLQNSKKLLTGIEADNSGWVEEALSVLDMNEYSQYEMAFDDFYNFFDFIVNENDRYFLVKRVLDSIGHIVEESNVNRDLVSGEEQLGGMEKLYDAQRAFKQFLSLTGVKEYRKKWPVIVGRVVTTDEIFEKYPDTEIPALNQ